MNLRNISKYAWLSFFPAITLSAITITLLVIGMIPLSYLFATFIMWCLISGLGVAVGYHRIFSHRTHKNLPRWKESLILFLGALSGQGSSIVWTAIHRGYHHPYSDTVRDLHSPVVYGKWHAFFGWTKQITENNPNISLRYASDLMRKSNHVWMHHHHLKILWGVPLIVSLFDWRLSLTACVLPTGISLIQDNLVNVFGHVKGLIGYRNFNTKDNSQNNLILGYLCWGQGFHNSHHAYPSAFDFGSGVSGKWWEFDPCRLWLWFLK